MTHTPARLRTAALAALVTLLAPAAVAQQLPFEQVVVQLKSPDAGARLSALRLLAESGYPEAAAPIAPLLSDPDPRIQREALATELSLFLGDRAAVRRASLVGRRDSSSAARAFEGNWSAMPAERVPMEVVTGMLALLKDRSAAIRVEAAYAVGVLGQIEGVAPDAAYKPVLEALAERLGDPEPAVRLAVARASGRVFRRCPSGCSLLALERIGDGLIRLLSDPNTGIQGAAMEGLGEIKYERAVKALTEAFGYYKAGEMAFGALDTLARIGQVESIPLFKTALGSKDPNFRRAAVEGLARTGDKDAAMAPDAILSSERDASVVFALAFAQQRTGRAHQVGRLVQALGDRNLRAQAQDYLIELGPAISSELAAAMTGTGGEMRVALLEVLGVTGTAKEAAAIEPLQNDRDPQVATAARRAVSRIRSLAR